MLLTVLFENVFEGMSENWCLCQEKGTPNNSKHIIVKCGVLAWSTVKKPVGFLVLLKRNTYFPRIVFDEVRVEQRPDLEFI